MAAFSRLQLAAALLEYDNDTEDPSAPYRSAHESAIFAHLRRMKDVRPGAAQRSTDFLGVSLPSDGGDIGARESTLSHRRSRSSINALHNPFGGAEEEEVDDEHNDVEVDLASWGLGDFIPKEKSSKSSRNRAKSETLPNPHPVPSPNQVRDDRSITSRRTGARSMSVGNFDFGVGGAFLEAPSSVRHSIASPLDLASTRRSESPAPTSSRRASTHALIESLPSALPLHSIPFPTGSPRSSSPAPQSGGQPSSSKPLPPASLRPHERTQSTASLGSKMLLDGSGQNIFSIRPPSPERTSRFDPKVARERTMSDASRLLAEDNPFAVRPPSPSRLSRFDPKMAAHARTISNASFGSRRLEDDGNSAITGQGQSKGRPYSTVELLRPKVLVMPSPLQSTAPRPASTSVGIREGFELSSDGRPLPAGARTARRSSVALSMLDPSQEPSPSNLFTPNPRTSLTLSQLTFRNTLMVGGQRDVTYSDIETGLARATEDGEQVQPPVIEEVIQPQQSGPPLPPEPNKNLRAAGKLYGRSLIDDLESRKAAMRGKQRVFTGDDRPSMMARTQLQRSSTFIDPASLKARPASQHMDSLGSQSEVGLGRRHSVKPLLDFNDGPSKPPHLAPDSRMPSSRSVFGVDTLWERELAKLKDIEEQERLAAKEKQRQEELDGKKKGKKKGKGKKKAESKEGEDMPKPSSPVVESRVSVDPPMLPAIQKATQAPLPVIEDETPSESEKSDVEEAKEARKSTDANAERWFTESSDEEDNKPRKTTGTGPRYPKLVSRSQVRNEDSDEDLPLAAAVERAAQRATRYLSAPDSDDEEKPLSVLLEKKLNHPSSQFDPSSSNPKSSAKNREEDDDDKPLGLRASTISPRILGGADDDDRPLALHPEHQRRTQYQMLAQQQQMMMQAQLQSNMYFGNPSMIGSGFFGPPMPPMMMAAPPVPMPSPPPMHDSAKYGRVDRWRHDVAVEGANER